MCIKVHPNIYLEKNSYVTLQYFEVITLNSDLVIFVSVNSDSSFDEEAAAAANAAIFFLSFSNSLISLSFWAARNLALNGLPFAVW